MPRPVAVNNGECYTRGTGEPALAGVLLVRTPPVSGFPYGARWSRTNRERRIGGSQRFLVEERLGADVLDRFLEDLESGAYTLDCGEGDLARVRTLVRRYADLSLGCVDAAVIACAERSGGRVMTFDLRDFGVVAVEGTITIVPGLPPSP